MELNLERRHSPQCPDRAKGPHFLKCRGTCKLRAVGYDDEGNRIRESLKTRDLGLASRRLGKLLESIEAAKRAKTEGPPKPLKTVVDAAAAFLLKHSSKALETQRKYSRVLRFFSDYCDRISIRLVEEITVESLDGYVLERRNAKWTWLKEIETLRQFGSFCLKRKWIEENPFLELERPKIHQANDIDPYTQDELIRIIAACHRFGRHSYERSRAHAMVVVMRYSGLRIGDVMTLSRDHVQGNYIVKTALKNKKRIQVEVPAVVLEALAKLPQPKAAPRDSRLYFASGSSSVRSLVKGAERTLKAVFDLAGVERAHAHRFRHSLASELIGKGEAVGMVASILGDSPAIISRHYAKWTPEYQRLQDNAIRKIHGTNLAQAEEPVITC